MSNNNQERTFVSFELDRNEKELFKKFVDEKRTTMSDFTRKAIWFFIDRDTTPEKFLIDSIETVQTHTPINIDLSKIDKLIERLDERDKGFQKALGDITREMKGMKLEIVTDIFDRIAKLTEEIDKLKKGD